MPGAPLGTDLTYGLIDDALNLVRVGTGIASLDVLNGALEQAPADGLFDEFREVAFFHAPSAKKRAQTEIRLLRDFDVPADGFFSHFNTYAFKQINSYTPIVGLIQCPGKGFRILTGDEK